MAELAAQRHVRPWRDVLIIVTMALLGFAVAPAYGATVTQAPTISADSPQLAPSTKLTASTGNWTPASATATYDWLRCNLSGDACVPISGACGRRYTVRGDDVDRTLRVRLTVTEPGQPLATARSDATGTVSSYGPNVGLSDTCTHVTSTGSGQGTFTSGVETGGGSAPAPTTSLPFIDPFPMVRISGRFRGKRTKLTRVRINAPDGARIRVDCKGRGCPYKRKALSAKLLRIRALQRTYGPKATIEIRVTQPQKIGKYTRVRTRKGKAPLRIDRCLMPGKKRPVICPTA